MTLFGRLAVLSTTIIASCLVPAQAQEGLPPVATKQTPVPEESAALQVPEDQAIRQAALQEEDPAPAADETDLPAAHPLESLAWMVGDWIDADDQIAVESSVNWTRNGSFLLRSFRVSGEVDEPHSGMQLIAWDPAEQRIRSWTYDSRGGFGEETWTQTGDRWALRSRFTLPDGGRGSSIQVIRRQGEDAYGWRSVSRMIDGTMLPDIEEVMVMRQGASDPDASVESVPSDSVPEPAAAPADGQPATEPATTIDTDTAQPVVEEKQP